jgi:maltose O-acetyltransferase
MKLAQLWHEEFDGWHWRLLIARAVLACLPIHVGSRVRPAILRLAGFHIGRGTVMWDMPTITGSGNLYERLHIGDYCWINIGGFFNLGGTLTIGNRVSIGHQVMFLTETHELGDAERRSGPIHALPVTIGDGAWLGARATILPGVTIGAGSIVASGALVTKDVPPNVLVAGVPAKIIKELP